MIGYTGWEIPDGKVVQVKDASGMVIWAVSGSDKVILQVEKITSNTYASETTYTGEQFILLDIYPNTNGTVSVTYGGLTKTITDTSGAEEPNAQQVFFGTFNGVSDSVETPTSGELTIDGDYYAFGCGAFSSSKLFSNNYAGNIRYIKNWGKITLIPVHGCYGVDEEIITIPSTVLSIGEAAFASCLNLQSITIENGVISIGDTAFNSCPNLQSLLIPQSVTVIGDNPVSSIVKNNFVSVSNGNSAYKIDGNGLIETETKRLVSGFLNTVIPSYVECIGALSFYKMSITSITIPSGVTRIGNYAFNQSSLTSVYIPASVKCIEPYAFANCSNLESITFEEPLGSINGWRVADEGEDWYSGADVDVRDPVANVTLIGDTRASKYLLRK